MGINITDKSFLAVFGVVLVMPPMAYADTGAPLIENTAGSMILLLIPIILIEAAILRKYLDTGYMKTLMASTLANVLSTIAGLPMAHAFSLALGFVTQKEGWVDKDLLSYPSTAEFLATAIQLLVAFFVSVYLEGLVVGKVFKLIEKLKIKQAVWMANEATYSGLMLFSYLFHPPIDMPGFRFLGFFVLMLIASCVLLGFIPKKWNAVRHRRWGIIAFLSLTMLIVLLLTEADLLNWASRKGDVHIVKMLIQVGAVVNAKGMDDYTPLIAASKEGHEDVARVLINNGAKVNDKIRLSITALSIASRAGHTDIVRLLIEHGADINSKKGGIRETDSPLVEASREGHAETVKLLIEKGVDAKTNEGSGALAMASFNGHTDIVKILKEAGAKEI
jgi:hypothetical protein